MQPCLVANSGCARDKENRRKKIALLGATFRGSRQSNFLFDLFCLNRAEGEALSLSFVQEVDARRAETDADGLCSRQPDR